MGSTKSRIVLSWLAEEPPAMPPYEYYLIHQFTDSLNIKISAWVNLPLRVRTTHPPQTQFAIRNLKLAIVLQAARFQKFPVHFGDCFL